MPNVDFETSVADFLSLGRRLQATKGLNGDSVLAEVAAWYRTTRVEGTRIDEDGDMLLIQWGETAAPDLSEPTDLREHSADSLSYADGEQLYFDVTRQVHSRSDDDDFDDSAVQMSACLFYGPAVAPAMDSNLWISNPAGLDDGIREIRVTPFVASLLGHPAARVVFTVDRCG